MHLKTHVVGTIEICGTHESLCSLCALLEVNCEHKQNTPFFNVISGYNVEEPNGLFVEAHAYFHCACDMLKQTTLSVLTKYLQPV